MTLAANHPPELSEPEDIPKTFAAAWNEKNAARLASIFDEHAEFVNVVGLWWHNREEIQKAHDYGFRVIFPESTLNITKIKTRYLENSVAVVHAKMHVHGQSPNKNQKAGLRRNIFTFVAQKNEGSWICVSAHNTDIIPGKETNLSDGNSLIPVDYRS